MKRLFHPKQDAAYRCMVWIFRIMDFFKKPDRRLDDFLIKKGMTVVDYGCGPGRYLPKASELVGPGGRVYAVDVHPMAIDLVKKKIVKHSLSNVVPVLIDRVTPPAIEANCADVIYALDMFHQIEDSESFLSGIHRIIKNDGRLYLEDGHQPRDTTLKKVERSSLWRIAGQSRRHLTLSVGA